MWLTSVRAPRGGQELQELRADRVHAEHRLGSGVFETVVAVLLLIPKTARLGAKLIVVWMSAVVLSHIFVLGYGWFFVDALMVMALAVTHVWLTRRHPHWGEPESVGTTAALQTYNK